MLIKWDFDFLSNKTYHGSWLFKSDSELIVEDSILVDNNFTKPIKQIVIKGIIIDNKTIKRWSLEKI